MGYKKTWSDEEAIMYFVENITESLGIGAEGLETGFFGNELIKVTVNFFRIEGSTKDYIPMTYGFNNEGRLYIGLHIYDGLLERGYKHVKKEVKKCVMALEGILLR